MAKPRILEVMKSVLAAFIGVQSESNRIKDFSEGTLLPYVAVGIIFTVAFVAILAVVVSTIL